MVTNMYWINQVTPGKLLKDARKKKKMSQRRLAFLLGVSNGLIPRYENNSIVISSDERLRQLSDILGIPLKDLRRANAFEQRKKEPIEPSFPKTYHLAQRIFSVMSEKDKKKTIDLFEMRIYLFNEDTTKLAVNFSNFLLGRLEPEDRPDNGLRPIKHYLEPWNSEIEDW